MPGKDSEARELMSVIAARQPCVLTGFLRPSTVYALHRYGITIYRDTEYLYTGVSEKELRDEAEAAADRAATVMHDPR